MSAFEFVFALFSLLLGLGMAEVLAGFAAVMKLHARARVGKGIDVKVGWLVPLLAALVVLNQLSFWMMAYSVRDTLPLTYFTLVGVLLIVGGYYLFSVLVFPEDPAEWPDFDLYYDQHNRFILIGMVLINFLAGIIANIYSPPVSAARLAVRAGPAGTLAAIGAWMTLALMIALIFVRGRRLNVTLLVLVICSFLASAALVVNSGL